MNNKFQKGIIESDFIAWVFLLTAFSMYLAYDLYRTEVAIKEIHHLSPLVKQEIREAVKDGIQADRDEKLQQLRNLPDESVKARFVHF